MEREGPGPPLHDLIGDELVRAMRAHERSRIALQAVQDSTAALAQTVETSRRSRQERAVQLPPPPK